jgi:hypothetical protein
MAIYLSCDGFDCGRAGGFHLHPWRHRLYRVAVGYRVPFRLRADVL